MTHYKLAAFFFVPAALLAVLSGCGNSNNRPAPKITDASSPAGSGRTINSSADFDTTPAASTSLPVSSSFVSGATEFNAAATTVIKTTAVTPQAPDSKTSFELPHEDSYKHAGETVSGQLVQSFSCDLTYDGANEDIGKYFSQDKNKYFYRVYRKGKLLNTVISPDNNSERSSECTIVHDGNTGEYHLAWVNVKNDNNIVLEYLDLSDNPNKSSTSVEFSMENNDTYIGGNKVSPEKCQQYLDNVTIVDSDERDLSAFLDVTPDQQPAPPEHTTTEAPQVTTTPQEEIQPTTTDNSAEITEIREYYEKLIADEQRIIDSYKNDERYNPALITASTEAFFDAMNAKILEKENLERSGNLEAAAEVQSSINELDRMIKQTEYSISASADIARHEEIKNQYQQEMNSKLAALQ